MSAFRELPQIGNLIERPELEAFSRSVRVRSARHAVDCARRVIRDGGEVSEDEILAMAIEQCEALSQRSLRRVLNLSGVVLHTGLGRARLAASAADAIYEVASNHCALELDLESGDRGDRQSHVRDLLVGLAGCEDALVVNNAAAAVVLSLMALGKGREVILSRGQMVEIGGAFRMPEIVLESGCTLVEVGCTNKTRLSDYARAMTPNTAAILRCHPSNYKIVGFSEEASAISLAQLAHEHQVLLIDDQGSGSVEDLQKFGLPRQATLRSSLADGADLVLASGDKLFGGPQAGLILGGKDLIDVIRRHPLARAVRIDKLSLAGLAETLRLYRDEQSSEIPTLRYLARTERDLKILAERIAERFPGAKIEEGQSEVGAGSAPGEGLPTWRVGFQVDDLAGLARRLRTGTPSVIGRIQDDHLWLDPRTLDESEVDALLVALESALR